MLEKELDLQKKPEESVVQSSDIERLCLAYSAEKDFSTTTDILDALEDGKNKENATLKVSRELVRSGRKPMYPPDHFFKIANQRESWNRNDVYEGITLLQAEMNDVSSALATAEITHGFSWFYIDLAKMLARKGENPQPVFDKIHHKLKIDSADIRWAGFTLATQKELGLATPKHLIDRFRVKDKKRDEYSNSYNLELAEAYARAGYPEDALEIWKLAKDTGYHYSHKATVLAHIAISQAKNGINPTEIATTAIEYADMLKAKMDKKQIPVYLEVEIYANLSRAYAAYHLDPSPVINQALQKASGIADFDNVSLDNIRADIYTEIAKAQVSSGVDARPTLALALEWADKVVKPGEEDNSGIYGAPIQLVNWEDIYQTQLTGGYFDEAHQTLERMDRYPYQDVKAFKVELLSELAREQAQKGLSSAEIDNLPKEKIQSILLGKDESAKQAVLYFGLDKKLV